MQSEFIWSDKWTFDNDEIWFLPGDMNVLLAMDYKKLEISIIDKLPTNYIKGFRQHPICVKRENKIFCLPDTGKDLWCYHILESAWTCISIENPEKTRIKCTQAWIIQDKLYILSFGLEKLIEVNVNTEKVDKYHNLDRCAGGVINSGIVVNNHIYIVGSNPPQILKFNCIDKKIKIIFLHKIKDILRTIAYDGENFWLSGKKRKIYLWRENENEVRELENIPLDFGIYNFTGKYKKLLNFNQDSIDHPLFIDSVCVGENIWYIPFQTNEIIFFNKITKESNTFSIENELLSIEDLEKQTELKHRYLLQYVRENRYIGLYSIKNRCIYEIDCQKKQYRILKYRIHHNTKIWFKNILFKQSEPITEQKNSLELDDLIKFEKYNRVIREKNRKMEGGKKIFDALISS